VTDRYAVIGNPVAHSKSPWIHGEFARETKQDIEYVRIEAPIDAFARTVDEFRRAQGRGANVTLPFKEAACSYSDELSAAARLAAAVNTLAFGPTGARGENTDGSGLLRDLTVNLGFPLQDRAILILGAGGAARGILGPLAAAGAARIVVANRTVAKATDLVRRLSLPMLEACGLDALPGRDFDLVINATSTGLMGEASPISSSVFRKGALAYELVYGRDTAFLAMARACGATTSDGVGMLVEQAADSFSLWRGVRPETARVIAALRAA
jgi:shikimate dehydrogenase